MTYEEIGATLKAEREKQNISIDAIADKLKISPRLIAALESGDISSLPHAAYIRGFIRSYAGLLGIRPDELQNWFEDSPGLQDAPLPDKSEAPVPAAPPRPAAFGKILAVLVILAILGGAGYWFWHSGKFAAFFPTQPREVDFESKIPSAADYLAENDKTLPPVASPVPNDKNLHPAEEPPAQETVSAPIETPTPIAQPAPEPVTEAKIPEEPPVPSGQHKLIITATEECWIHSNADKTDTRQFSLRKGDTFALTFTKSLELKLGNAGGVRLRYDGKDLGPAGTSGQVKTIVYPPAE